MSAGCLKWQRSKLFWQSHIWCCFVCSAFMYAYIIFMCAYKIFSLKIFQWKYLCIYIFENSCVLGIGSTWRLWPGSFPSTLLLLFNSRRQRWNLFAHVLVAWILYLHLFCICICICDNVGISSPMCLCPLDIWQLWNLTHKFLA